MTKQINIRDDLIARLQAVREELECSWSGAMDVLLSRTGDEEEDEEDEEEDEEDDDEEE